MILLSKNRTPPPHTKHTHRNWFLYYGGSLSGGTLAYSNPLYFRVLVQPLYSWQSTYFFSGYSSVFQMCDTIQGTRQVDMTGNGTNAAVPNATAPGPEGAGLEKALPNYAAWVKNEFLPLRK